jgi:type I protein arginine methyltransferase
MYSVYSFGKMIADTPRMAAYERALRAVITPETTVLDIGAGTGIATLLACQMGARHVYAIEPNEALQIARECVAANGFKDRVTFYPQFSTEVSLPQPVDVMVSDLRGVLPLFQHHIPSIVDARQRLLKPGGVQIGACDTLWVDLVSSEPLYREYQSPWIENPFGLNMAAGRQITANTWRKQRIAPEQMVGQRRVWATLDYRTISQASVRGSSSWTISAPVTVHGLGIWFDAELYEGITFSNAPDQPELIYGMGYFPLEQALQLASGDMLTVTLEANFVGSEYIWSWHTKQQAVDGSLKVVLKQSTFYGTSLSLDSLRKRADGYVPAGLNTTGQIDLLIMSLLQDGLPLSEIAQQTHERFPARFPTVAEALTRAGELSEKYT